MHFNGMALGNSCGVGPDKACLAEFWNKLRIDDDPGGTTWDVLEPIERRVTDLLYGGTVEEIRLASRLTAKARYLWLGGRTID